MADTVYLWRVHCETDGEQFVWNTVQPTTCPLHADHVIDGNLTSTVQEVSQATMKLQEESIVTQGVYQCVFKNDTIPAGNPGTITTIDYVWPNYPVTVLNGYFNVETEQVGDEISFCAAPNTIIGVLTAPTDGTTTLHVSPTVLQHVLLGFQVALFNGVTTESLGICTAKGTSTITVKNAPVTTFAAQSYVQITVEVVKDLLITNQKKYSFAKKKIGGKAIPAGTVLRVYYKNNNGVAKKFCACLELIY